MLRLVFKQRLGKRVAERSILHIHGKHLLFGFSQASFSSQKPKNVSTPGGSNHHAHSSNFPCITIQEDGTLERGSIRFADIGFYIHPRDLLALDIESGSASAGRNTSLNESRSFRSRSYVCLPRQDFFLISFSNIKAIVIKGDLPRVLIFEPNKTAVEEFGDNLAANIPFFNVSSGTNTDGSFELGVLEETLKEACGIFDRRIRLLKPLVQNLIQEDDENDEDLAIKLQKLGPLEDAIQVYELEVKEARQCILRLLQNDEDMHGIVSTEDPTKVDLSNLNAKQVGVIANVELLLENYVHKINRSYDTLIYFRQKLNTWKSMTTMSMHLKRNKIMNYNLHMGIAAVSIGTCSACAGIFGMNLTSGLENHPWAFYGAAATMVSVAGFFQLSLSRHLFGRHLNLTFREQASRIEGMKTILIERADSLDDAIKVVFDVLDDTGKYKGAITQSDEDGKDTNIVSKEHFHRIFTERVKSLSKSKQDLDFFRNVSQLFELLDVDKNEYLDRAELAPSSRRKSKDT